MELAFRTKCHSYDRTTAFENIHALIKYGSVARSILDARSERRNFFSAALFSEPAWDILLELFVAYAEQERMQVSSIGLRSGIPQTTLLRWLNALMNQDLIERKDDPLDRRRTFVSLSPHGANLMASYLQGHAGDF